MDAKFNRTCSIDRDKFALCDLYDSFIMIPQEFQYFNHSNMYGTDVSSYVGSIFGATDFCPFDNPRFLNKQDHVC